MAELSQAEVLAKVRATLGQGSTGRFCYVCGQPGVRLAPSAEGELFVCTSAGHRSPRAYIFDGKARFSFEEDRLVHETSGAIIQRLSGDARQTLLFLRRKYPFQYTIPAGHVEGGHEPEDEMRREVWEETGLTVREAEPVWPSEEIVLYDPCRRGADWHRWHIFRAETEGLPRLSDEGRIVGWYNDDEVQDLAASNKLTPPVRAIFKRLELISLPSSREEDRCC